MYFLSIIVLCFLFLQIFGRPRDVLQDYDKDSKDNSYRDSVSGDSDDYLHYEQKSSLKQFSGNEPATKAESQEENSPNTNEEVDNPRSDKEYLENNDENQVDASNLSHNDGLTMGNVKRTAAYGNGIMLFHDNEKNRKIENNEYNYNEKVGLNHNVQHSKQYNTFHNIDRHSLNRDRRHTNNNYLNEPIGSDEVSTTKNEINANLDEETAIRRHVKKLSKEELDELLHSLSKDEKALLKNIMDNSQQDYDNINKREITKKAGANEENSFVGNEQSDTSKIQGGSANLEAYSSIGPNFEKQENTKKIDTESNYSKSTEIANSSEKSSEKINVLDNIEDKKIVKSDNIENLETSQKDDKISGNIESEKEIPKKENKREVNSKSFESFIEDPAILESLNKEESYCSEDENRFKSLYNDNRFKRELCSDDLDSIKSLEESFPNVEESHNFKPGSNMPPLIRVKRNNYRDKIVEKRDANVLSNLKVPYFSSVLENNEDGSDERGEFQDDGFFDRGANFAKSGEIAKQGTEMTKANADMKYCEKSQSIHEDQNKLETDTVRLGSDTDVVVSGIEGVDDNVMYNSGTRMRRTGNILDNLSIKGENAKFKEEKQFLQDNDISEEYNKAARYQENDAFGSLPRNYEQDLGRFKRIRRLKPDNNVSVVK